MNSFGGINKETHRAEIAEIESQDAANCFFHKGRVGLLGQREGKTFLNSTAYPEAIVGHFPLMLPSGTQRGLVATNNGEVVQTTTNNTSGVTNYLTGNTATGGSMDTSSLVLSHPDVTASLLTTCVGGTTYNPANSLFASWGWAIAMSIGTWTSAEKLRLELGVNEAGVEKYLWTMDWTMQFQHAWTLSGLSPAALHNATGTITGMCARLSWPDGWPAGAAGGDSVTISSLVMG